MVTVVGLFLAGLALFFFGVAGIRTNLQQLTGGRFRRMLHRGTRHGTAAAAWGVVFGAVTQSATAVSFILAGLIAGGTLPVARALTIVGWANIGTAVLVFLATIDVQIGVYYVIGLAGLAVAFDVVPRVKPLLAAVFSAGLLLLGLELMKEAFAPLPGFGWFHVVAEFARGSDLAAAAFGMVLRTVVQSSSAIAVLAIVLSHAGLLTHTQIVMMIFGAAVGVTLASVMLSLELRGVPRQIVIFHGGVNGVSGLVFIALVLLETATGWPLVLSWIDAVPGDVPAGLSVAYLMLMTGSLVVAAIAARHAPAWLERWSPPTVEQGLSEPKHLQHEALRDPEIALELIAREEDDLLSRLPGYLEAARAARAGDEPAPPPEVIHRALAAVARAIQDYSTTLSDANLSHASSSTLLALERRRGVLEALNDNLRDFAVASAGGTGDARTSALAANLIEAADAVLLTAVEGVRARDVDELTMLAAMTEDRGTLMEGIRRRAIEGHGGPGQEIEVTIFHLTSLFERIIWLLRQLGASVQAETAAPRQAAPPA